ncbi:MAG: rod shape-determining protein MreC [Lachnospiraceae bacterium]|nr:rod shape-determining protein MreC [Lachnospiraceae bacterium]
MADRRKKISIRESIRIPSRYLLLLLSLLCILLMVLTFNIRGFASPFETVANYMIVPFQKGVSSIGEILIRKDADRRELEEIRAENRALKEENKLLQEEQTVLKEQEYELMELRKLLQIEEAYPEYEMTGARIIARDNSNWYHSFLIGKGENDGLLVDMNVLSENGLIGRLTAVGPDWARVSTIIDDNMNVSGTVLSTSDILMVSGDLKLYESGTISYGHLNDTRGRVKIGDKVVTSNISEKYLPGILIGYIASIENDANNLTKSGELIPATDFSHLNNVLVVMGKKQLPSEE